jgi:hypothetical protein
MKKKSFDAKMMMMMIRKKIKTDADELNDFLLNSMERILFFLIHLFFSSYITIIVSFSFIF